MLYFSTRGGAMPLSFDEVLLAGVASDGGLYVPQSYPEFSDETLRRLRTYGYHEVVFEVLQKFCTQKDIPYQDLYKIVFKTYTKELFGSSAITPLKELEKDLYLLKLSQGPTLAFKDIALQLVTNLIEYILERQGKRLTFVTATSGDTGAAAQYAVRGKKNEDLFVLSPDGERMSLVQRMMMWTIDEPNIHNIVIDAPFSVLQAIVKQLNYPTLNSINWARIVAQVAYYVYAYLQVTKYNEDSVTFAVPSGNFGNAYASHVASQMGISSNTIVCTNKNDVLDVFFKQGIYRKKEVSVTSSPSMDIEEASNLERWVYDWSGRSPRKVRDLWSAFAKKGEFVLHERNPGDLYGISSGSASEEGVIKTIRLVYENYKIIIDPHTAVAMKVALDERDQYGTMVVAETAQPAKFAETIKKALGFEAPMPKGYEHLLTKKENVVRLPADVKVVGEYIRAHSN